MTVKKDRLLNVNLQNPRPPPVGLDCKFVFRLPGVLLNMPSGTLVEILAARLPRSPFMYPGLARAACGFEPLSQVGDANGAVGSWLRPILAWMLWPFREGLAGGRSP